jgi:hypothetical protein
METLDLTQFYGSEKVYFNPLYKWLNYTDGVKYFLENAGGGAYWLLDIIGTELHALSRKEQFLSIKMTVADNEADITVTDGNDGKLYSRHIEYTDCPAGQWDFFLTNNVLMLPSEY